MKLNDRDMYYNSYGYSGMMPGPNMNGMGGMPNMSQLPGMMPGMGGNSSNYMNSQINDMNERISRLERQVKRLDQRLTRIETPYANQNFANEPDNNMYMM